MEKISVENVELEIPEDVVDDIFKSIINEETWSQLLSEEEKCYLSNFLPHFDVNDAEEKEKTLKLLFSGANFAFGNPLKLFHNNLKDGLYNPDVSKLKSLCLSMKERQKIYDMEQYYERFLCEAVIRKQKILDGLYKTSHNKRSFDHPYYKEDKSYLKQSIHYRVNERCLGYLKEIKIEVGDSDSVSSDDDDNDDQYHCEKIPYFSSMSEDINSLANGTPVAKEGCLKPIQNNHISNDDYEIMMKKHRKRKRKTPKLPELDTTGLNLDDIISRSEFTKRPKLSLGANKLKKTKQGMENDTLVDPGFNVKVEKDDLINGQSVKEERVDSSVQEKLGSYQSFFSLLKEFICAEPGHTISLNKLENSVAEWQLQSANKNLNDWYTEYPSWCELVSSALKFLSGELEGAQLEDFDPPIYQMDMNWSWKRESSCDDNELSFLYYHWMELRNNLELSSSLVDLAAPVPPPRMFTDYVVQGSNANEKELFRQQEMQRFTNPHKAFTYCLHGYESVVGPIKGVYNRENSAVKAREHALLVNERPACVNILTLVHDSAARLPNGEGTRSDICELLKDSQFLAPGVADAQINTIVSGALDRLHYERDPCVKYDSARKVWIYRHRHRTEAEFERIHQIQRNAVKAKKLSCTKKNSLSKLQMSILKQKETSKQHCKNSSSQPVSSSQHSESSSQTLLVSSPAKFLKAPVVVSTSSLPSSVSNVSAVVKQSQQHIHTVLQLPDGSIIKANSSTKQPGIPLRMAKISTTSGEKTYSLLTNRNIKSASSYEQESVTSSQVHLQPISSSLASSPALKPDNQLRLISHIQQSLLQQQKQQHTLIRASPGNLTSTSVLRPGIHCSTTVASLISNQKTKISNLVANPNVIVSKTGTTTANYVSQLLRGNALVIPSSTSGQSSSSLQGLICVTIANSNLAHLNQGGLIKNQPNTSNVRVLSLPTKVLISEQHPQKNILIGSTIGQPTNHTLANPSAIYLANNLHGKPIIDSVKSLPATSILNPTLGRSLGALPRTMGPSIPLLSPNDVKVAIMRPNRVGSDHSATPQLLHARLPTSLQGFFQIVSRTQTQTTTSK